MSERKPSQSFDLARLRQGLKPFALHWFPRLRSTNDHATSLRKRGELFAPAVVLTGHQLAGRGRGANSWWSDPGSLTATFVFGANEHLAAYHVPLIAGIAARNAAVELTGNCDIQLKWPNDLLFEDRKIAGLLCERVHKADLIGIGVNLNLMPRQMPRHLRDSITGLNLIAGRNIDPTEALLALARQLHKLLWHRDEQSFAALLREYDSHHSLRGRRVTVTGGADEPPVSGICEGLDDMGRLLLRQGQKLHRIIAGNVRAW